MKSSSKLLKSNLITGLLLIFTQVLISSCAKQKQSAADELYLVTEGTRTKYDLLNPSKKFLLPYVLEEVSGLSFYKNDIIACIQDESGKIFFYDINEEKITHTILFEYSGDYEGIEIINNSVFVVKSNGDLFNLNIDFDVEKSQASKIETAFDSKNNIEGLGFDATKGKLILVTKDQAGLDDKKDKDSRGVYSFDLDKMKLDAKPLFVVTMEERRDFYKKNNPENSYDDKRLLFKPSGIAVHPIDGNYYILASVGKILLVVSSAGDIIESYTIKPGILTQPEGICFAPDGTMYIASEGDGDRGFMLRFDMLK
ncbi:MAG: SdiA-regulated domain-containing protein [Bacteroidetes bacterium]|nr:SdiA-regulated domain-containing protein [Bacteroidota bacterium]MDA1119236.1 SdiA-regulated domain-containing protein [Bacteroidota bacterium]